MRYDNDNKHNYNSHRIYTKILNTNRNMINHAVGSGA